MKVHNIFPIISLWERLVPRKPEFDPICPKYLYSLSPTRMILHIKFYQDWPTTLRDIEVTFSPLYVFGKNFRRSRACNSEANSPIWPKITLVRDFMPILVTCKFEELIKNEGAIMSITFFLRSRECGAYLQS